MQKSFAMLVTALAISAITLTAQGPAPLKLVDTYKMPEAVKGHFDHFGVDLKGSRLFSAAEGYKAVLVFDLHTGKLIHTMGGLGIPHAILYRADAGRIYVTDGGEGALKVFDGETYSPIKSVKLLVDADSIAYDPATNFLYVVNGGGDAHQTYSTISVVDTNSLRKVADIKVDGDTLEAMALEATNSRMYVNNRAKNQIEVIDRVKRAVIASWPVMLSKMNVAMALDPSSHRLFVGCRSGVIVVMDTETGKELEALPIEKGVDDLVFDPVSKRIYAACGSGSGSVDVYQEEGPDHYRSLGRVPSSPGGRNALLVPQLNRYFVAAPGHESTPAEVMVYQEMGPS